MSQVAPRFRNDLSAEPVVEGEFEFVEVRDGSGRVSYRLYAFEHAVARELDGRPLDEVAREVEASVGLEVSEEQLAAFASRLAEIGLLEPATPLPNPAAFELGEPEGSEPTAVVRNMAALLASVDGSKASAPSSPMPGGEAAVHETSEFEAEPSRATPLGDDDLLAASSSEALPSAASSQPASSVDGWTNDRVEDDGPERARTVEAPALPNVVSQQAASEAPVGITPPSPVAVTPAPAPPAEPPAAEASPPVVAAAAPPTPVWSPAPPTPADVAPPAPAPPPRRGSRIALWAVLGLLAAGAVAYAVFRYVAPTTAKPVSVRTVVPMPASVYRWFEPVAEVRASGALTLSFPAGGKVVDLKREGARFAAGDVLGVLEGGKKLESEIAHFKERLAYYEQMHATMATAGNRGEVRQAEIKIAEKKRLIAERRAELAKLAIVAPTDGEVLEPLVAVGAEARPGAPALRIAGERLEATFALGREDAHRARRLAFCRVEVEGRPFECDIADGGDETHIVIELPPEARVREGAAVRLARARFDGVFTVPASALVQVGNTERLFVAGPNGRAEVRAIAVAERGPEVAIVTQGLDVGEAVIVDVPRGLRPNAPIAVRETAQF